MQDPRTFFLKRKHGIKFPSIRPLALAVATDHFLKNEFDKYRDLQLSNHWLFEKYKLDVVPYQHSELTAWRDNFKGIRYIDKASNLKVFGAIVDIWKNSNSEELHIVDYKSTSKKVPPILRLAGGLLTKGKWKFINGYSKKMIFTFQILAIFSM